MEQQPKKATDVLVEILDKVNTLIQSVASLDLKIGLVSNKLNDLLKAQQTNSPAIPIQNRIVMEAANTIQFPDYEKQLSVSSEDKLPEETSPVGFRRTSRPETFAGDDMYLKQPKKQDDSVKFPIQVPKSNGQSEVIIPKAATEQIKPKKQEQQKQVAMPGATVPTMQRIVDRNGKSVFLADVEVLNFETSDKVLTTRTNGTGKWQAALPLGQYKVIVRKRESLTKDKVEIIQNIVVDGTNSPLELQTMIIK